MIGFASMYLWVDCTGTDESWSRDGSKSEVGLGIVRHIYVNSGRLMISSVSTLLPFETGLQDG